MGIQFLFKGLCHSFNILLIQNLTYKFKNITMKKNIILAILLAFAIASCTQSEKTSDKQVKTEKYDEHDGHNHDEENHKGHDHSKDDGHNH